MKLKRFFKQLDVHLNPTWLNRKMQFLFLRYKLLRFWHFISILKQFPTKIVLKHLFWKLGDKTRDAHFCQFSLKYNKVSVLRRVWGNCWNWACYRMLFTSSAWFSALRLPKPPKKLLDNLLHGFQDWQKHLFKFCLHFSVDQTYFLNAETHVQLV